jgi:hypothetical protein
MSEEDEGIVEMEIEELDTGMEGALSFFLRS